LPLSPFFCLFGLIDLGHDDDGIHPQSALTIECIRIKADRFWTPVFFDVSEIDLVISERTASSGLVEEGGPTGFRRRQDQERRDGGFVSELARRVGHRRNRRHLRG
jgi:hypothetical protein